MDSEEKYRLFREAAHRFEKYHMQVANLDLKLEALQIRMENVHSPSLEKAGTSDPLKPHPVIELLDYKERLEAEKKCYADMMRWVLDTIESIPSRTMRVLVWMSCVQRRSLKSISEEYGLNKDRLYNARRNSLAKAVDVRSLEKYMEIRSSFESLGIQES